MAKKAQPKRDTKSVLKRHWKVTGAHKTEHQANTTPDQFWKESEQPPTFEGSLVLAGINAHICNSGTNFMLIHDRPRSKKERERAKTEKPLAKLVIEHSNFGSFISRMTFQGQPGQWGYDAEQLRHFAQMFEDAADKLDLLANTDEGHVKSLDSTPFRTDPVMVESRLNKGRRYLDLPSLINGDSFDRHMRRAKVEASQSGSN